MPKFHINDEGEPRSCVAASGNCPYGEDAPHFSTKDDARTHYEYVQKLMGGGFTVVRKGPDHDTIPLHHPKSKEAFGLGLATSDLWHLDPYEVGEYGSYQELKDNMGDFDSTETPMLSVERFTEVFDDEGNRVHSDHLYSYAAFEETQEEVLRRFSDEMDANTVAELAAHERVYRHTWVSPHKRVTLEMFFYSDGY